MRVAVWLLTVLVLLLGAFPAFAEDEAEATPSEEAETAIDKSRVVATPNVFRNIPSVTNRFFARAGRVEMFALSGVSLDDPFFTSLMGGAGLAYHVVETWSLQLSGETFSGHATAPVVAGKAVQSNTAYVAPRHGLRLSLAWAPLYGKLNLLGSTVVHFDTFVTAGYGVLVGSDQQRYPSANVSLGQHFFFHEAWAVRVELREQLFRMARVAQAEPRTTWQTLLTASVGLCYYFGKGS